MSLSINDILKEIQHHAVQFFSFGNLDQPIHTVKFFSRKEPPSDPEILYIGKSDELPESLSIGNTLNILAFTDTVPEHPQDHQYLNNHQINLILLKEGPDILSIFNEVQDIIKKGQESLRYSADLLKMLVHNSGFQNIIDIGYKMLGNPLYVMDLSSKVLAVTKDVEITDDMIWSEVTMEGYLSYNTIMLSKEIGRIVDKSTSPLILKGSFMKYLRIIGKVELGNTQAGIVCVLEYEKPFDASDIEIVTLLCNAISLEMQKNKYSIYNREIMGDAFIEDLLEGKIKDHINITEKTKILGLSFQRYIYVLTIDVNDFDSNGSLPYMKDMAMKIFSNNKCIIHNGNIVVIFSCSNQDYFTETTLNGLQEFLRSNNMFCGVSRSCSNLEDSQEYYFQSLEALKLGKRLNKEQLLFRYDDYVLYHIADDCYGSTNLIKYCHPSLLTLIAFDKKNNTDYTHSLHVYLQNMTNLAKSANALHIHRNTMIYRIKKIEKIMHIKLQANNILLHLHLSFIFIKYLNSEKSLE